MNASVEIRTAWGRYCCGELVVVVVLEFVCEVGLLVVVVVFVWFD